jgi:hypothetical protein
MRFGRNIQIKKLLIQKPKDVLYKSNKNTITVHLSEKRKIQYQSELSIYEEMIYENSENLIKIDKILEEKKKVENEYITESTIQIIENNKYSF